MCEQEHTRTSLGIESPPKIRHDQEFPLDDADSQTRFSTYFKEIKHEYEDRILQVLVMTELFPITDLTTDRLVPVVKHVSKCEVPITLYAIYLANSSPFFERL